MGFNLVTLILVGSLSTLGAPHPTLDDPAAATEQQPSGRPSAAWCQLLNETLDGFTTSWTRSLTLLRRDRGPFATLSTTCGRVNTEEFRTTVKSAAEDLATTIVERTKAKVNEKAPAQPSPPPARPTGIPSECKVERTRSDRLLHVVVKCIGSQTTTVNSPDGTTTHISQRIHVASTTSSRAD